MRTAESVFAGRAPGYENRYGWRDLIPVTWQMIINGSGETDEGQGMRAVRSRATLVLSPSPPIPHRASRSEGIRW